MLKTCFFGGGVRAPELEGVSGAETRGQTDKICLYVLETAPVRKNSNFVRK